VLPKSSDDPSIPRFTWWDHRGTGEWVQFNLGEPTELRWVEVYWFDDTGRGGCRVPASWKLLYQDAGRWRQVGATGELGTEKDKFNRATFNPITTGALRIWAELQPDASGGILEARFGK
jgi:hypothetical protein